MSSPTADAKAAAVRAAQHILSKSTTLVIDGYWGTYTNNAYLKANFLTRLEVDRVLKSVAGTSAKQLYDATREQKQRGDAEGMIRKEVARTNRATEIEKLVIQRARAAGIDGMSLVNLLANIKHESGFIPRKEDHRYTTPGLAQRTFSALRRKSNAEVAALVKAGREAFFEATYGLGTSRGADLGNVRPGDGGKYYGRGLLQITGRDNYTRFTSAYPKWNAVDDPEILTKSLDASIDAAIWFWKTWVVARGKHLDPASAARAVAGSNQGVAAKVASAKQYSYMLA